MAGTLNDEQLRGSGGPTVNDGLMAYYLANGGPAEGTLNDRALAVFRSITAQPEATIGDAMAALSDSPGGTLNDKLYAYWSAVP